MSQGHDPRVVLSVFDRLTDHEPRQPGDPPTSGWEQMLRLKRSVARDLTDLLNTRRAASEISGELVECRESILAFGIEDLSTAPMDREAIRRNLERCIRIQEPRLSRIQITFEDSGDFAFSFRITAMLKLETRLEPVAYDAELPKDTRRFRVREGR